MLKDPYSDTLASDRCMFYVWITQDRALHACGRRALGDRQGFRPRLSLSNIVDILDLRMRQRSTAQPQPRLYERYDRTAMDMSATDVLSSPQLP
jgi:hypothetical protein